MGGPGSGGHNLKLTPETADLIVASYGSGMPMALAAAEAGVDDSTIRRWVRAGRRGEDGFVDFATRLMRAKALRVRTRLQKVEEGGKGFAGAVWELEHVHKLGDFADPLFEPDAPTGTDALSPEAIDALLAVLAEKAPQKLQRALEGRTNTASNDPEPAAS